MKQLPNIEHLLKTKSKLETLFSFETKYDNSRFDKNNQPVINENIIYPIIHNNINCEWLDEISRTLKVDIIYQKTLINIRGNFDNLSKIYSGSTSNKVKFNKNKTISIKYNNIDISKRKLISEYLKPLGINYVTNANESYFYKTIILDDNVKEFDDLTQLFIKVKAMSNLFLGDVKIHKVNFFGVEYIVFKLVINSIKYENITTFYTSLEHSKT